MSHAITPQKQLTAAVAQDGTFTLDYPVDHTVDDFTLDSPRHVLGVGSSEGSKKYYEGPDNFTVSFGATEITVTWKNATSIPDDSWVRLQLDKPGANRDLREEILPARVREVRIVEISLGKPDTSDDDFFFASAAFAAAGEDLLQTTLDVPRNIIITSSGNEAAKVFTVTGTDEYGETVVENITGPNATVAAGVKAFKTVESVEIDADSAGNVKVGFGDVLGLPTWIPSAAHVLEEYEDGAGAVSGTFVAGLARATISTATTADVRGTYDPNSACNAAKHFQLLVALYDPTYHGNQQFAG